MTYKYRFNPVAAYEYEDAYFWYSMISDKLGDDFLKVSEERIKLICNYPYRYRNTYRSLREISLKKYPYTIIYDIDEQRKTIIITAVYHHRRNPKRKYKRKK